MIWEAYGRICGERLKAAIPILLAAMERHGRHCTADGPRAGRHRRGMQPISYARHRFPPEVVRHATKQGCAPRVLVTDKLRSDAAATRERRLAARDEQGLRANDRAENSHRPVRRRERKKQGFTSPGSTQRFRRLRVMYSEERQALGVSGERLSNVKGPAMRTRLLSS